MKILLPVDGSDHALRATQHAIAMLQGCQGHEIHLINVQAPIDAPEVLSHMPASEIEAMQETRGGDALAASIELLKRAGIGFTPEVLLGPIAETIDQYATDQGCDKIVMGTRGLGAVGSLMGSITTRLLHLTELPVTLVK